MTATEQMLQRDVKACADSIEEAARNGEIEEYVEDAFDVEILCDLQGNYRGARIALAIGGPSIFLDTASRLVEGRWGGNVAEWYVRSFAVDQIDSYLSELWEEAR